MAEGPSALYPKRVELNECDKEPIHILGKIQNHGYLIVCDAVTQNVTYCSANTEAIFDKKVSEILGSSLTHFFESPIIQSLKTLTGEAKSIPQKVRLKEVNYLLIAHSNAGNVLLELEPYENASDPFKYQIQLSQIVTQLNEVSDEQQMCDVAATLIKKLYDYDRVMIYRFDENWDGFVLSEAREDHLESWLGLRYPASDIPQQARKLFLKQGVRIISNVNSDPVAILAAEGDERENPVDLSGSELRASSPIHIEYLKNMNVGATLTAAIVSKGTLWGLIACHHYKPKFINYYERESCKFLTQVFSNQLILSSANTLLEKVNASAVLRNILIEQVSKNWDISDGLINGSSTLLDLTEADGAALLLGDTLYCLGQTPAEDAIRELINSIRKITTENSYYTSTVSLDLETSGDLTDKASGVLCVFISKLQNDCMIWFKPEKIKTVTWAGNPDKAVKQEKNFRLSPRKSFEKWSVEQKGKSEPWKDYEIAAAAALRQNISEIILKKYEEVKLLNRKLKNAYEDLETFSYSVAHDLRAPLRGVDGFTQILKEDYYEQLDDFGKSSIETILDSAKNMNQLIDDILEFSRVSQFEMYSVSFQLSELVEDLIDFLKVKVNYPNTQIICDPKMPPVYGDPNMIRQLVQNLITNALKYSEKASQPKIEVGSEYLDGQLFYYVKDNGIGFEQKHDKRIFKLFNRLVGEEYEGSGIGLAIVARIVKKHGGKLLVKSEPNEGSIFYFSVEQK